MPKRPPPSVPRQTTEVDGAAGASAGRVVVVLTVLVVVLIGAGALRVQLGSTGSFGWPQSTQLREIRINRLAIAGVVGAALAVSGVGLQSLLRNPLAEPFILGLTTGAGVGLMAQLMLEDLLGRPIHIHHAGPLAGAALSLMIVYLTARRNGVIDPLGLLLVGVVLSTINGAVIMFLNLVPGSAGVKTDIMIWMMGFIGEGTPPGVIRIIACLTALSLGVLVWYGPAMDVASLSDAEAESVGVNLKRLRTVLFVVASVLAAGAVVLAGPVAFVGLICPHLVRLLLGPSHRPLVIGAALAGSALLIAADLTSVVLHRIFSWGIMPLGIFTALLGGIFFLWLLRSRLGRMY